MCKYCNSYGIAVQIHVVMNTMMKNMDFTLTSHQDFKYNQ